jgi:hypothetical protein
LRREQNKLYLLVSHNFLTDSGDFTATRVSGDTAAWLRTRLASSAKLDLTPQRKLGRRNNGSYLQAVTTFKTSGKRACKVTTVFLKNVLKAVTRMYSLLIKIELILLVVTCEPTVCVWAHTSCSLFMASVGLAYMRRSCGFHSPVQSPQEVFVILHFILGVAQWCLATDWTTGRSRFDPRQWIVPLTDWFWGPPSLLSNGYRRSFLWW